MPRIVSLNLILVMTTLSVLSQTKNFLNITTDVNAVITDPSGKKTGMDSRFSKPYSQWTWMREIPNSAIGFETDDEVQSSSVHFEAYVPSPQGDGTFRIELIGDKTWVTYLSVSMRPPRNVSGVQKAMRNVLKIPIEEDSSIVYLFTYHSALGSPISLVKVVSARSLIQDLAAMRKLGWISSQVIANKYSSLIVTYSSQMQQSDYAGARASLTDIIHNIASDSSISLTADACKSLRPDVESLLQQK
jgi:hypothetical protein